VPLRAWGRHCQLYLLTVFVTGFVNLYTHDIEAGLHFYRDLPGFAETFRAPAEGIPEHVELRLNELWPDTRGCSWSR
jgi:hypothetical protein